MRHDIRWTSQKIAQRLRLAENLVYRRRFLFGSFRLKLLAGPQEEPAVDPHVADSDWVEVQPNSYWVETQTNFLLRSRFAMPSEWGDQSPVALFLPLGVAGDFRHPEALAYVDGTPFAACDRHHQEILLPRQWFDGRDHTLALHGWSGGTHLLRFEGR